MIRTIELRRDFILRLSDQYFGHVILLLPSEFGPRQFMENLAAQKRQELQQKPILQKADDMTVAAKHDENEDEDADSNNSNNDKCDAEISHVDGDVVMIDDSEFQLAWQNARDDFLNDPKALSISLFYCSFCDLFMSAEKVSHHCRSTTHIVAKDEADNLPNQACPIFLHGRPMLFDHHVIFPETIFGGIPQKQRQQQQDAAVNDENVENDDEKVDDDDDGASSLDSDIPLVQLFEDKERKYQERRNQQYAQQQQQQRAGGGGIPPAIMLFDDTIGAIVMPDASRGVQLCPGHEYSLISLKLGVENRSRDIIPKTTNTLPSDTDQNRYYTKRFAQVHHKAKGPYDLVLKKKKRDAASAYLNLVDGADFPNSINVAVSKGFLDARDEAKIVVKHLKRTAARRGTKRRVRKDADLGLLMVPKNVSSPIGSSPARVAGLAPLVPIANQHRNLLRRKKRVRDRVVHLLAKTAVATQKQKLYRERMERIAYRIKERKIKIRKRRHKKGKKDQ